MKAISIAILVLTMGIAASETSLSVVAEETFFGFIKFLNFQINMKSGTQSSPVEISKESITYVIADSFKKLKAGDLNLELQITIKDTTKSYKLDIIHPRVDDKPKDENNSLGGENRAEEVSKESSDKKDRTISTSWVNIDNSDCDDGNLESKTVNIDERDKSFVIKMIVVCKNEHLNNNSNKEAVINNENTDKINEILIEMESQKQVFRQTINDIESAAIAKNNKDLKDIEILELAINQNPSLKKKFSDQISKLKAQHTKNQKESELEIIGLKNKLSEIEKTIANLQVFTQKPGPSKLVFL
jgi:hypothetical protein